VPDFRRGVPPLLPGGKSFGYSLLSVMMAAKIWANKGVIAKFAQTNGLWVKCEAPGGWPGAFLDFYFKYNGLRGTNVPTLFSFV
jgi:hypothetical protein